MVFIIIALVLALLGIYFTIKSKSQTDKLKKAEVIAAVLSWLFAIASFLITIIPDKIQTIAPEDSSLVVKSPESSEDNLESADLISPTTIITINDKSVLSTITDTKRADLYAKFTDIKLEIKTEDNESVGAFGDIIEDDPEYLSLINTDYNVDCSEYIKSKDDEGFSCLVFEDLIPGYYTIKFKFPGFSEYVNEIYLDPTTVFNDQWSITHHLMSMQADTFYHAGLLVFDESLNPIEGVEYAVKYLENEYFLYLGETDENGNSEYFFHCAQNTGFYINLSYKDVTYETKINFNQTHTGLAFMIRADGSIEYLENYWD